jgi:RNA polymerase sigma factor (sigma-70 family)
MKERWALTKEEFAALLSWLGSNPESAGKKYEVIRQSLIKIFTWRGFNEPEDLADETINRVTKRLRDILASYKGDPALYFYGVAKNIIREQRRRASREAQVTESSTPAATPIQWPDETADDPELPYKCMNDCIERLKPKYRELFLRYYSGEPHPKTYRKELTRQMGMTPNALRVRIKRIRTWLQKCIKACMEKNRRERNSTRKP